MRICFLLSSGLIFSSCFAIDGGKIFPASELEITPEFAIEKTIVKIPTEKDLRKKSVREILKKAEQGDAYFQLLAGKMYKSRLYKRSLKGAKHDMAKSIAWFKKSAVSNRIAQRILAQEYEAGVSVPQDYEKAFRLYEKSAAQGDAFAFYGLGKMYEKGEFVEKNFAKAEECYLKAADLGLEKARIRLGNIYYIGSEVGIDRKKACSLYKKALESSLKKVWADLESSNEQIEDLWFF